MAVLVKRRWMVVFREITTQSDAPAFHRGARLSFAFADPMI